MSTEERVIKQYRIETRNPDWDYSGNWDSEEYVEWLEAYVSEILNDSHTNKGTEKRIKELERLIPKFKSNNKVLPQKIESMEWELRALKAERLLDIQENIKP